MGPISRFAARHQIWFVLASVAAWLVLLVVFMGLASSALGRPYGDRVSGAAARLTLAACVVAFVWRLGWLRTCGIARLGDGRVWLLAAAGLGYSAGAFLYAFYSTLAFDASIVIRLPAARTAALAALITALGEEVLFRGLALHALARVWGRTRAGLLASVVLAALLFAALHGIQVLTNDLPRSAALLLILQALVVSIWWGGAGGCGREPLAGRFAPLRRHRGGRGAGPGGVPDRARASGVSAEPVAQHPAGPGGHRAPDARRPPPRPGHCGLG